MSADELLVFNYPQLQDGLVRALGDLSSSQSHREFFLKDPGRYLTRAVSKDDYRASKVQISLTNRLFLRC